MDGSEDIALKLMKIPVYVDFAILHLKTQSGVVIGFILCQSPYGKVIDLLPVWREIGMGFSHMSGAATNMGKQNSS